MGQSGPITSVITQPEQESPQEQQATVRPNDALVQQMYDWRNDPQHVSDKAHTDRWDRALLALGESVSDTTLTPMSAAEAQTYADRGWTRWEDVADALSEREAGTEPVQEAEPPVEETEPVQKTVPPPLYDSLVADVNTWRDEFPSDTTHTGRWDRVLLALGEPVSGTSLAPMTATEAWEFVGRGWYRWREVARALDDVLTGTGDADTLHGGSAGELLVGLGGDDTLIGLSGDDDLRGGNGDDDLTGGTGSDRFVFFSGETGAKAITDFEADDVIVLKGSGWPSIADIIASVQAVGSGDYSYALASGLTVETTNNRPLRTEDFVLE